MKKLFNTFNTLLFCITSLLVCVLFSIIVVINVSSKLDMLTVIILVIICINNISIIVGLHCNKNNENICNLLYKQIMNINNPLYKYFEAILIKIFNSSYNPGDFNKETILGNNIYFFTYLYPRIFLVLCLFIDIFIYHEIYFFYMFSFLFLIEIIWKYILYILRSLLNKNLKIMTERFVVEILSRDDANIDYFTQPSGVEQVFPSEYFDYKAGDDFIFIEVEKLFFYKNISSRFGDPIYEYVVSVHPAYYYDILKKTMSEENILKDYYILEPITLKLYSFFDSCDYYLYRNDAVKKTKRIFVILELLIYIFLLLISFKIDLVYPFLFLILISILTSLKILLNKLSPKTKQNILVILGAISVISFIWLRFVRHIPLREIPYSENFLMFLCLGGVCIGHIYVILRLLKPKPPNEILILIAQKFQFIAKPVKEFDSVIRVFTEKKLCEMFSSLYTIKPLYQEQFYILNIYYYIYIFPRIILLLILFKEIIINNEIDLFYKFSFLYGITIFWQYILYCLRKVLEKNLEMLEKKFYVIITSKPSNDINYYIPIEKIKSDYDYIHKDENEFKQPVINIQNLLNLYNAAIWWQTIFIESDVRLQPAYVNTIRSSNSFKEMVTVEKLKIEYQNLIDITKKISGFLFIYNFILYEDEITKGYVKNTNIILIFLYLCCWSYIFIISFYTDYLYYICVIIDNIEPFSGLFL